MTVINIHAVEVLGKRCKMKLGPDRLNWIEGIAKDALIAQLKNLRKKNSIRMHLARLLSSIFRKTGNR